MPADRDDLPVKSIGTTFRILERIAELREPDLVAIADAVDASKSTVLKHLQTLERLGYVQKQDGYYVYTVKMDALSGSETSRDASRDLKSTVTKLSRSTGEIVGVMGLDGTLGEVLIQRRGEQSETPDGAFEMTPYLHASAPGKAILSSLPDEVVRSIVDRQGLPSVTTETITDEATLREQLELIDRRGVAFERGESVEGVNGLSVPLDRPIDGSVGAIYVVGPEDRLAGKRLEQDLPGILLSAVE